MKPATAARLVDRLLSVPALITGSGIAGAFIAAGPASAQAIELADAVARAPDGTFPGWLAPLMPLIIGATSGAALAVVGWIGRTFFGVGLVAIAAAMEAGGAVIEARARKSKDPLDDAPASALAAALKAAAAKLRDAEHDMPGSIKRAPKGE